MKKMNCVFLNASQNRNGNTAALAKGVFAGVPFTTIDLVDHHINQLGQESVNDDFFVVIDQISRGNVLVIGTPVYWSDMTGYLKTFIDRLADTMDVNLESEHAPLKGMDVYLIVQGTAPDDAIPGITTVIKHVCKRFFLHYKGLIRTAADAGVVNSELKGQLI